METAKDISEAISPYLGQSGTCSDEFDKLLKAINQIRLLLWNKTDYTQTLEWVNICCVQGCFYLPARYETIRYAKVCGYPVDVQNEWFQITRPDANADLNFGRMGDVSVIEDLGNPNCKFREYTKSPYLLEAYSESGADAGKELQFNIRTPNGRWIKKVITLAGAFERVSLENECVTFIEFTKPETIGGVRVFAHDVTNNLRQVLGIFQPFEKNPLYKKYTAPDYTRNTVSAKAKLKRFDLKTELDLVEFPVDAMILAAQAITYRKNKDTDNYTKHLALAIGELQQEMLSNETRGSTPLKFSPDHINTALMGDVGGYGYGFYC